MSLETDLARIGSFLEDYTYENIMQKLLAKVPDTVDKREGSIIFDTLAVAGYEIADYYIQLRAVLWDVFGQTAMGEYLDLRAEEFGITRRGSTYATKYANFKDIKDNPINVPIGTRFSIISDTKTVYYKVTSGTSTVGTMVLTCEMSGTVGNEYIGQLLPLSNVENVATAEMTTTLSPARDDETDEQLRERFFILVNEKQYGGNFIDYVMGIKDVDGVGGVQCYPVWAGGGTVKVVIIDNEYDINTSLCNLVKDYIDPEPHTGEGQGLSPIGHQVTVVSPTKVTVNITMDVELTGMVLDQVQAPIVAEVTEYFLSLRKRWDKFSENHKYYLYVYRAQIISRIIENVTGVSNVKNVKLNGVDDDLQMKANKDVSELPFIGGVTINEIFSE